MRHVVDDVAAPPYRLPAAIVQEWFYGPTAASASAFPVPVAWRLRGPLDRPLLDRALQRMTARHEALRTTLERTPDGLVQLVWESAPIVVEELDCSPPSARRRLARVLREQFVRPFELDGGRLARALLVRIGADEQLLLLVLHHAVSDGLSSAVLRDELPALLAEESGGPPAPPPPTLQFADYAGWERERGVRLAEASRPSPRLRLPLDAADWTVEQGFRALPSPLPEISRATVRRLALLAREERATLGAGLLATVAATFAPCADGPFTVGMMHGNRERPELHRTVGFLALPRPVHVDVAHATTFRELVGLVRDAFAAADADGFARATRAAAVDRDELRRQHPFDVVVNYVPVPEATQEQVVEAAHGPMRVRGGVVSRDTGPMETQRGRGNFGLIELYFVADDGGGLAGSLIANERIVSRQTAVRLGRAFAATLRQAVVHPERLPRSPLA